MSNITDDLVSRAAGKAADKGPQAIADAFSAIDKTRDRTGKMLKGICLIMGKGVNFTTENVMKAVKEKALQKTGDIKYSRRNVSIAELSKSGYVKRVDEKVTADVMKHFDAECKAAGVKYSAMKDEKDPQNPQYYIFYEGKTTDVILHVMQEAYKDFMSEQEKKARGRDLGQDSEKKSSRESIRAKLAFFRDRVAAGSKEQDTLEKHHAHPEPQR